MFRNASLFTSNLTFTLIIIVIFYAFSFANANVVPQPKPKPVIESEEKPEPVRAKPHIMPHKMTLPTLPTGSDNSDDDDESTIREFNETKSCELRNKYGEHRYGEEHAGIWKRTKRELNRLKECLNEDEHINWHMVNPYDMGGRPPPGKTERRKRKTMEMTQSFIVVNKREVTPLMRHQFERNNKILRIKRELDSTGNEGNMLSRLLRPRIPLKNATLGPGEKEYLTDVYYNDNPILESLVDYDDSKVRRMFVNDSSGEYIESDEGERDYLLGTMTTKDDPFREIIVFSKVRYTTTLFPPIQNDTEPFSFNSNSSAIEEDVYTIGYPPLGESTNIIQKLMVEGEPHHYDSDFQFVVTEPLRKHNKIEDHKKKAFRSWMSKVVPDHAPHIEKMHDKEVEQLMHQKVHGLDKTYGDLFHHEHPHLVDKIHHKDLYSEHNQHEAYRKHEHFENSEHLKQAEHMEHGEHLGQSEHMEHGEHLGQPEHMVHGEHLGHPEQMAHGEHLGHPENLEHEEHLKHAEQMEHDKKSHVNDIEFEHQVKNEEKKSRKSLLEEHYLREEKPHEIENEHPHDHELEHEEVPQQTQPPQAQAQPQAQGQQQQQYQQQLYQQQMYQQQQQQNQYNNYNNYGGGGGGMNGMGMNGMGMNGMGMNGMGMNGMGMNGMGMNGMGMGQMGGVGAIINAIGNNLPKLSQQQQQQQAQPQANQQQYPQQNYPQNYPQMSPGPHDPNAPDPNIQNAQDAAAAQEKAAQDQEAQVQQPDTQDSAGIQDQQDTDASQDEDSSARPVADVSDDDIKADHSADDTKAIQPDDLQLPSEDTLTNQLDNEQSPQLENMQLGQLDNGANSMPLAAAAAG